jgi:site-specific DNA recombinase
VIKRRRNEPESSAEVPCGVYCRKSTEEGLDSTFSSMDNQREAAENYIRSQAHERWVCLPDRYDDGGFSGGSMDRPALKRLLADVESGKVRCVLVYRVDRLSRSLLDFSNMVATLDRHGASFVSVTEAFNTKTPVGRMTMNLMATFAEYERAVIRERTRDKMHAAKRKGKWVGGMLPLGYDLDSKNHRLVVNEKEAETVRTIYSLYADCQSLADTLEAMATRGIRSKRWTTLEDKSFGGGPWTKTRLSRLLSHPVYLGKVELRGTIYDGEQPAIVSEDLWHRVQGILRRNSRAGGRAVRNRHSALLRGILECGSCSNVLTHTYTRRHGKLYRYYSHGPAKTKCPTRNIPAAEVEAFVVERIQGIGRDPKLRALVLDQMRTHTPDVDPAELAEVLQRFTPIWAALAPREQARALQLLVSRVVHDGERQTLSITFRPTNLGSLMEVGAE